MTALAQAQALREACEWDGHALAVAYLRRLRTVRACNQRYRDRLKARRAQAELEETDLLRRVEREAR